MHKAQGASQGPVGRVEPDSPAGLFLWYGGYVSEEGARRDGSLDVTCARGKPSRPVMSLLA